ncbi:uroporphyrinogen-III synthase [Leucobacter sp. GX24907]
MPDSDLTEGRGPLAGRTLAVVRGGAWGARVAEQIRERGGEPVIIELLRIAPPRDSRPLEDAVAHWNGGHFDWLVITSANGADAFADAGGRHRDGSRIAAVGPATAAALERRGLQPDLVPDTRYSGSGIVAAILDAVPRAASFLLPVSEIASETVERELRESGHRVQRVDAYRTIDVAPDAATMRRVTTMQRATSGGIDAILVTSGSAARAITRHLTSLLPDPTASSAPMLAAIGEPTASALQAAGWQADVIAETHTISGLLDAVADASTAERVDSEPSWPPTEPPQTDSLDCAEGAPS